VKYVIAGEIDFYDGTFNYKKVQRRGEKQGGGRGRRERMVCVCVCVWGLYCSEDCVNILFHCHSLSIERLIACGTGGVDSMHLKQTGLGTNTPF